jgi:hypothetical protein
MWVKWNVTNATITFKDSMMLLMIGLFMSVTNVVGLTLMKVNMNKIRLLNTFKEWNI